MKKRTLLCTTTLLLALAIVAVGCSSKAEVKEPKTVASETESEETATPDDASVLALNAKAGEEEKAKAEKEAEEKKEVEEKKEAQAKKEA